MKRTHLLLLLASCGGGSVVYVSEPSVAPGTSPCGFHVQKTAGDQSAALLGVCVDEVSVSWRRDQGRVRLVDPGGKLRCAHVSQAGAAQLGYDDSGDRPVRDRLVIGFQERTASFLIDADPEEPASNDAGTNDLQQLDKLAGKLEGPITVRLFEKQCADVTAGDEAILNVLFQSKGSIVALESPNAGAALASSGPGAGADAGAPAPADAGAPAPADAGAPTPADAGAPAPADAGAPAPADAGAPAPADAGAPAPVDAGAPARRRANTPPRR